MAMTLVIWLLEETFKFFALAILQKNNAPFNLLMHHLIRKKMKIKFLKNSKVPLFEVLQTPTP